MSMQTPAASGMRKCWRQCEKNRTLRRCVTTGWMIWKNPSEFHLASSVHTALTEKSKRYGNDKDYIVGRGRDAAEFF